MYNNSKIYWCQTVESIHWLMETSTKSLNNNQYIVKMFSFQGSHNDIEMVCCQPMNSTHYKDGVVIILQRFSPIRDLKMKKM